MNIHVTQQIPADRQHSGPQSPCLCHDKATVEKNANQLARTAELLALLDGFLRPPQHRR